ncbi:universal stress protein [Pseudomonas sp. TE3610]
MVRPKRLVLIAGPQAVHSPTIGCAGKWAKALRARLQMVAFVHAHLVDLLGHAHASLRDKARQGLLDSFRLWLSSEAVLLREQGVDVHYEVLWATPSAVNMAAYAQTVEADLVIKGFNDEPHLKRLMMSSLDWDLLATSHVPVLYVDRLPTASPQRVLVAVDAELEGEGLQSENAQVIRQAIQLASDLAATVDLVTVYDPTVACAWRSAAARASRREGGEQRFHALATQYGFARPRQHFLTGAADFMIADYLRRSAYDLLVIGSANHHLLRSDVGASTQRLLENPRCNVLVLKLAPLMALANEPPTVIPPMVAQVQS